jgi:hypothetical protein
MYCTVWFRGLRSSGSENRHRGFCRCSMKFHASCCTGLPRSMEHLSRLPLLLHFKLLISMLARTKNVNCQRHDSLGNAGSIAMSSNPTSSFPSATGNSKVYEYIEEWKSRLIDLSRRNRLLCFKHSAKGNLLVTSPDAETVFSKLVNRKRSLDFWMPPPEEPAPNARSRSQESRDSAA